MIGDVGIASETVVIDFPIADVFEFLADGTNNSLWHPGVRNVIFAAGPTDRAVWAQTIASAGGKTHKADYRVSEYEHPGRIEFTVFNGPQRPTTRYDLRSLSATSTEVTCSVDVKPLVYPFERTRLGRAAAQTVASDVRNLGAAMTARRPKNS